MEVEKCSKCNGEVYSSINGIPFCAKHYVENYRKDKRFLQYQLEKFLDYFSRDVKFDENEKELLKEIKKQFPEVVENYSILFDDLN